MEFPLRYVGLGLLAAGLSLAATSGGAAESAPLQIGLLAGAMRSGVGPEEYTSYHSRDFPAGGVFAALGARHRVTLVLGAQLLTRGYEYSGRGTQRHTARYLEAPVLLRFGPVGPRVRPYLLVGPSGGLRLNDATEGSCSCSSIGLPRLNLSGTVGAGVMTGRGVVFLAETRLDKAFAGLGATNVWWRTYGVQLLLGLAVERQR